MSEPCPNCGVRVPEEGMHRIQCDEVLRAAVKETNAFGRPCGCRARCGDLPEADDRPYAVCRVLPL